MYVQVTWNEPNSSFSSGSEHQSPSNLMLKPFVCCGNQLKESWLEVKEALKGVELKQHGSGRGWVGQIKIVTFQFFLVDIKVFPGYRRYIISPQGSGSIHRSPVQMSELLAFVSIQINSLNEHKKNNGKDFHALTCNTQSDHLETWKAYVSEINLLYIYSKGIKKVISNKNSWSVSPVSWSDASECFQL